MIYKNGKPHHDTWLEKIVRRIRWKLDFLRWLPHNIKCFISNLISYAPIFWEDRDWDFNYFNRLMHHKLVRMEKHMRETNRHTNSLKYAKQMKIAINLLDRIIENNYCKEEYKKHTEKWSNHIMDFVDLPDEDPKFGKLVEMKSYTEISKKTDSVEQEHKESMEIHRKAERMRQADLDLLYTTLRKHIERWWV